MIRIVIADDHSLIRQGVRSLLDEVDDIEVVGEAVNGQGARELVEEFQPDILLIDINMPGLTGIQVTEQLIAQNTLAKIVILSCIQTMMSCGKLCAVGPKGICSSGR